MKTLRIFGLVIINLVLIVCLFAMGSAITANFTALSPHFITSQVNRLDLTSLTVDVLADSNLPAAMTDSISTSVTQLQPQLKSSTDAAVYDLYDYLKGNKPSPDLVNTLRSTVLSPNNISAAIDSVSFSNIATSLIKQNWSSIVPPSIPPDVTDIILGYISPAFTQAEPLLKSQLKSAAGPIMDYVFGQSPTLHVVLDLAPVTSSIQSSLQATIVQEPPLLLAPIPASIRQSYVDEFMAEFNTYVPSSYVIDPALLGTSVRSEVADRIARAEDGLARARHDIRSFRIFFTLLAIITLLVLAGIIFLYRRLRDGFLNSGIIMLVIGGCQLAGTLVARHFTAVAIAGANLPGNLETVLPGLIGDFYRPLTGFAIGLMALGTVFIILSVLFLKDASVYRTPANR